jgi:hypothetical protein
VREGLGILRGIEDVTAEPQVEPPADKAADGGDCDADVEDDQARLQKP